MAGTTRTVKAFYSKHTPAAGAIEDGQRALVEEYNKVIADLELLRSKFNTIMAKLDADTGVTDTNYAATAALGSASAMTAALISSVETGTP